MATELEFSSLNIQLLLIIAIIGCVSLYFYIELKKIKYDIEQIKSIVNIPNKQSDNTSFLNKLMNPLQKNIPDNIPDNIPTTNVSKENVKSVFMEQSFNPSNSSISSNLMKQVSTNPSTTMQESSKIIVNKTEDIQSNEIKNISKDNLPKDNLSDDNLSDDNLSDDNLSDDNLSDDNLSDDNLSDDKSIDSMVDLDIDISELDKEIDQQMHNLEKDYTKENDVTEDVTDIEEIKDIEEVEDIEEVKDIEEGDGEKLKEMTVNELKTILIDLKLPVSGNKTKLITRIIENTE